jgi:hypothetical protein
MILSFTLHLTNSYVMFLVTSALATLMGAALFAMTGSRRARAGTPDVIIEEKMIEQAIKGEVG